MKILKIDRQENKLTNLSYSLDQRRTIHAQEKRPFLGIGIFVFFFLLFAGLSTLNAQTVVNPGDNLNTIVKNSNGGTITVKSGTYDPLLVEGKKFSASNPLIIKAADGADVTIKRVQGTDIYKNPNSGTNDAGVFTKCSYIAIEGIKFNGGHRGVTVHRSDHIIFRDCDFTQTQEAGVKVEDNSAYIDFIGCLFAHTGIGPHPWFGEALYVGRGSYPKDENLFPDACKFVWVEGCEFHHTGRAEAINIKAEAFGCTIRGNNIHDIILNDATDDKYRQTNAGAISLDHNLGIRHSATYVETYREGDRRENWVENNTIKNVRTGQDRIRPNNLTPTPEIAGIYSAGTGNNIVGNTVSDVNNGSFTHLANGIRFNKWSEDITKNYVWNNKVSNTEDGNTLGELAINQNPGTNPNKAQSWYPKGNNNDDNNDGSATIVVSAKGKDGTEKMSLLLNDKEVQSWNVTSTSFSNYNYSGNYNGEVIKVALTNDEGTRDLWVDHVEVAGQKKLGKDQAENTGAWEGTCGGGSFTNALHCNGHITFGSFGSNHNGDPEIGNKNIVVRAKGKAGSEEMALLLNDKVVETWTVNSTSYSDYNYTGSYKGENLKVSYSNDTGNRDLYIDYVDVAGQRKQAEEQTENTGAWEGTCGGGSLTEALHCNGHINFNSFGNSDNNNNPVNIGGGNGENLSIVVRARGKNGDESMRLLINNKVVKTWNLNSTSYSNYTYTGNYGGEEVKVEYFEDSGPRDLFIDYVEIGNQKKQAEEQAENTGAWKGTCGGGSFTERIDCNGYINFGSFVN